MTQQTSSLAQGCRRGGCRGCKRTHKGLIC